MIDFSSLSTVKRRLQTFGITRTTEVAPEAVLNLVEVSRCSVLHTV